MPNLTLETIRAKIPREGRLPTQKGFILRMKGISMSLWREPSRRMILEGRSMKWNKEETCLSTRVITVFLMRWGEIRRKVTGMDISQTATRMNKSLKGRRLGSIREREGIMKSLWENLMQTTGIFRPKCPWILGETALLPLMMLITKISRTMRLMQEAIVTPCTQAEPIHQNQSNLPMLLIKKIMGWSILEEMRMLRPESWESTATVEGIHKTHMKKDSKMPMTIIFITSLILHLKVIGISMKKDSQDKSTHIHTKIAGRSSSKPLRNLIRGNHKPRMDTSQCQVSLSSLKNCYLASKRVITMGSIGLISMKEKKLSKNPLKTHLRRVTKEAS